MTPGDPTHRPLGVVIPAHNESTVIGDALTSLQAQRTERRIEVIVVAANCVDDTADISRGFAERFAAAGHRLRTVEVPDVGKASALNAGDAMLRSLRTDFMGVMFLDADAVLSERTVEACARAIEHGIDLVAPSVAFRSPQGRIARRYLRVYSSLPQVRDDTACRGCYVVSARGRTRWNMFPEHLPDDAFVRAHFVAGETRVIADVHSEVPFPEDSQLTAVVARWAHGNTALRAALPTHQFNSKARRTSLRAIATTPTAWPALPTFLRVRWRAARLPADNWTRGR